MTLSARNPWIVVHAPAPEPVLRLFCFPYAGGGASAYRGWRGRLPPGVELLAVQPPGREGRLPEPPIPRMAGLAEAALAGIRPLLDRPFVFFGHSMGGLLAYEVALRLQARDAPRPAHLWVSGSSAPADAGRDRLLHNLPDDELTVEIGRLGGTPRAVLEHRELMALILPVLRADLAACETYVPRVPGLDALDVPITVLVGDDDREVPVERAEGWRAFTHRGCTVRTFPGDHFFLQSREAELLAALSDELVAVVRRLGGG